ncbi:MAG: hypothetical protein H5T64_11860 [Chloroflexi bacterium]|nr:hypothetical protein [Chloroflexota bacterium]
MIAIVERARGAVVLALALASLFLTTEEMRSGATWKVGQGHGNHGLIGSSLQVGPSLRSIVLVNSQSPNFPDFEKYIRPYLDFFGVPYRILDLASENVCPAHSLYIFGHKNVVSNERPLSETEKNTLENLVKNQGVGIVSFDYGQDALSFLCQRLSSCQIGDEVLSPGPILITAPHHYIGQLQEANHSYPLKASITLRVLSSHPSFPVIAALNDSTKGLLPLVLAGNAGNGRVVIWTSYQQFDVNKLGPFMGLDDLVWRGIVWAAKKPFLLRAVEPMITVRVDDVRGDWYINPGDGSPTYNYIQEMIDVGFTPFLAIFVGNEAGLDPQDGIVEIAPGEAAQLKQWVDSGQAQVSLHAIHWWKSFYYQNNGDRLPGNPYPDEVINRNILLAKDWFDQNKLAMSTFVIPHFGEMGKNALQGVATKFRTKYLLIYPQVDLPYYDPYSQYDRRAWAAGPYYKYNQPSHFMTSGSLGYADYYTYQAPDGQIYKFFVCFFEPRVCGYDWVPPYYKSRGPATISEQPIASIKRCLSSLTFGTVFLHEQNFKNTDPAKAIPTREQWVSALNDIKAVGNSYNAEVVSMETAIERTEAVVNSKILDFSFDPQTSNLSVTFDGESNVPTRVYLFVEVDGAIRNDFLDAPPLAGPLEVNYVIYLPRPTPTLAPTQTPTYTRTPAPTHTPGPSPTPTATRTPGPVATAHLPITSGWNLLSLPIEPDSPAVEDLLAPIAGAFDLVYAYEGCDEADPWKKYDTNVPPFLNDLQDIPETVGFWLHGTSATTLPVSGHCVTEVTIHLCEGWNLVGYPLSAPKPVAVALTSIDGLYDLVYSYDASDGTDPWKKYDVNVPPFLNDLTEMRPGWGYWIHANSDCALVLSE